ncbi:hypothetical protein TNCV_5116621 [Trichonephila clavipes]|nr:hypothetical protein TNCV_5116621 [Trichonephila clavipes]
MNKSSLLVITSILFSGKLFHDHGNSAAMIVNSRLAFRVINLSLHATEDSTGKEFDLLSNCLGSKSSRWSGEETWRIEDHLRYKPHRVTFVQNYKVLR